MTELVNQPTAAPSRKIWAVIIAAAVAGAAKGALNAACGAGIAIVCAVPDLSGALEVWVYGALIVAAGYFTRERA